VGILTSADNTAFAETTILTFFECFTIQ